MVEVGRMGKRFDKVVEEALRELLAENGRKGGRVGGRSRSEAKVAAARENIRKALEVRWKKKFRRPGGGRRG